MTLNTAVMDAIESLRYRATVGDVASQAGLDLNTAQQGLNALASETQAHLQVSEAGEIAYEFPKDFRAILRNKFWRLRLQETWARIWQVLFYLIRISFGILLLVSIVIIVAAITILLIALNSSQSDDDNGGGGGGPSGGLGFMLIPRFWIGDLFWFFYFDYGDRADYSRRPQPRRRREANDSSMNFLEAVFSFLFGDGNPNADLDERRWQIISTVIRNNGGAVVAEQVAPYLDDLGEGWSREDEDYMLPVLTRFNGVPQVSPEGGIIYHFPELQVTARDRRQASVPAYLKEQPWQFSQASGGQLALAGGLGGVNFVGALILGALIRDPEVVAQMGGFIGFVSGIYWLLLAYGIAFLAIPAGRYFWIQRKNRQIAQRNEQRQEQAMALNRAGDEVQAKLTFARQFANQTVVSKDDLAYTTEKELTEQEAEQREKLDAEWRRRLESSE